MKKTYYQNIAALLLLAMMTLTHLHAQQPGQLKQKVLLTFEPSGRLTSFPPTVVRDGKKICLRVAVPRSFVLDQVHTFKGMLEEARDSLTSNKALYDCFFDNRRVFDFSSYLAGLNEIIGLLDDDNIKGNDNAALATDLDHYDYVPAAAFIRNLFHPLYQVKIYRGTSLVKPLPLNQVEYDAKKECYYFNAPCQKVKELVCAACGSRAGDELVFKLTGADPLVLTIQQWFEDKNKALSKIKYKDKEIDIQATRKRLDAMAALDAGGLAFSGAYHTLDLLKPWYPYWFWYTKGEIVLDPFQTRSKKWAANLKASIKELGNAIDSLQQQKRFTDSTLAHLKFVVYNFPTFGYVQSIGINLSRQLSDLIKQKAAAEEVLNARSDRFPNTQPKRFLNKVSIFRSGLSQVHPQVQFDASREYKHTAGRRRQLHRVTEMPENERPVLLVHNIDSAKTVKYGDAKPLPFSDDEEFTSLVIKLLGEADPSNISSDAVRNLQNAASSFVLHGLRTSGLPEDSAGHCGLFEDQMMAHFHQLAEDFHNDLATFFYTSSIFSNAVPDKPVYSTLSKVVKVTDAPIRDSIPIFEVKDGKDSLMTQANLKIGKLIYITVVAGLAMTDRAATVTTIDTTGSGFRVSSADNKARAVIGFKLYPFQYYKRDRWLIPRYPLRRLSLFGGFELLHPINNFYIGGCYDIVPGLGFSVGANYYLQTKYKIENNTVVDTHRSYKNSGTYYAVVVNPLLFASFVKYLFKAL